jgi:hypothetical protein
MEERIIYVLKRKTGFPLPSEFYNKYRKMTMEEVSTHINKEVIILYKYKYPLFGNYEKEFLYRGVLILPITEKHLWISVNGSKNYIFITKTRFESELEAYILKEE